MTCRYCEGKTATTDTSNPEFVIHREAPKCAFPEGVFVDANWDCGTMNHLRDIAEYRNDSIWNEDQWGGIIPVPDAGKFIVLGWYKSRGRTENARVMNECYWDELNLTTAYAVIAAAREGKP